MKDYVESFTESYRKNNARGTNPRMWDTQFNEESEITRDAVIESIIGLGYSVHDDGNSLLLHKQ